MAKTRRSNRPSKKRVTRPVRKTRPKRTKRPKRQKSKRRFYKRSKRSMKGG